MRKEYDFSQGRRGAVLKTPPGKTRITIRLDDDILEWFRVQVHAAGGGNYQTLINQALREYVDSNSGTFREVLRSVIREELTRYGAEEKNIRERIQRAMPGRRRQAWPKSVRKPVREG